MPLRGLLMFRIYSIFVLTLVTLAAVNGQIAIPKPARELSRFETLWLTAHLNGDQNWLSRFSVGKFSVIPPGSDRIIDERSEAVAAATATRLEANEIKVRISGTISLLTNDSAQNRSFHFLDTFNKIGGKWRVIASSISPSPVSETSGSGQIERELLQLENVRAQASVTNNVTDLDNMLSSEFVGTTASGAVHDRREWIHSLGTEAVRNTLPGEMKVRVVANDLAIVTGVEIVGNLGNKRKATVIRFTNTWAKRSGAWQCVAAHLSRIV